LKPKLVAISRPYSPARARSLSKRVRFSQKTPKHRAENWTPVFGKSDAKIEG
jgi:hypothetical protein